MKKSIAIILLFLLFACNKIIYQDDISTATVHLIAPANNVSLTTTNVHFSWEQVEGATTYQLQVAKPNFANATQIVLDTTIASINFTQELQNSEYQWRIKAKNEAYETAFSTNAFTVSTVNNFSGNTVVLQSPADQLITNQANQTLIWETIAGATDYRIQLWQPNSNGTLALDEICATNQKIINFNDGTFTWQVRAQNATANTAYTSRTILIDTTVPNTATLLTPTNNQSLADPNVTFTWQRTVLAGSTETEKIFIYSDINLTNLVHQNIVSNNSYSYTLSSGNTYYWVMQSYDEAGNQSAISATFSFSVN